MNFNLEAILEPPPRLVFDNQASIFMEKMLQENDSPVACGI